MLNKRHKSPAQTLAIEAEKACMMSFVTDGRHCPKIGQYYDRLPQETKDILKNLTSNDTKNIRHPLK